MAIKHGKTSISQLMPFCWDHTTEEYHSLDKESKQKAWQDAARRKKALTRTVETECLERYCNG